MIEAELVAQGHAGVTITRTDLFPSNGVIYADARHVPQELKGVRTLFASFHHFRPDEAKAILRDARDSGQSICVFEVTRRGALPLILMLLTPLIVLFVTPRVRPRRWTQLLFTYPIPILPLLIAFDGLVSILRTYTVEELGAMTTDLNTVSYRFEPQDLKAPGLPFPLPVLLGRPTAG